MIKEWLHSTAEWQNWGWNVLIVSFLATVCFNVLQSWSLVKQIRTIGRLRSGESISVPFFAYMTNVFFVFLCYGAAIDSLASVINGTLGLFYGAVLVRLRTVRRFTPFETLLACAPPFTAAFMVMTAYKAVFLAAIMALSLLPMLHQAWTLWRTKRVGAIEPRFLMMFTAAATFWAVYAFAIGDLVLEIINPVALAIQLVIVMLWLVYRNASPEARL